MRVLIAGVQGQLGRALQVALRDHHVVPRPRAALDITDPDAVRDALAAGAPDLVINAAAYNAVDQAETEPDVAFAVNAHGPRILGEATAKGGIPLLHVSTDYVFDGSTSIPYDEEAQPNPLSSYARSKLAGEEAVRETNPKHYVVRTAWLYATQGRNFPLAILERARRGERLRVVDDQWGSPTYVPHLAAGIARLIATGAFGTYHLAGSGGATWYELTCVLFDLLRVATPVERIPSADLPRPAIRPRYSVLTTVRTPRVVLPPWREGVAAFAAELAAREHV